MARLGNRDAQYEVGLMYANGLGTAKDLQKAIEWVSMAAQKGLAAAQYLLATRYAHGVAVPQDERAAMWWLFQAAEQGNAKAQFKLGQMLSQGHPAAGREAIRAAAEQGHAEAQFALAQALSDLAAAQTDQSEALDWLVRAAQLGLPAAQCALAERYEKGQGVAQDLKQATRLYRKAARQDHPQAQLALEYLDAKMGRQRAGRFHPSSAERRLDPGRWLHAAETGDADAKYCVGLMYDLGLGVEHAAGVARSLYTEAARLGHAKAQLALAQLLQANDLNAAKPWLEKASEAGVVEAHFHLAQSLAQAPDASSRRRSLVLLTQAAQGGYAPAQLELALLLDASQAEAATDWLEMAAQQGLPKAQYLFGLHLSQGRRGAGSVAQATQWWDKAARNGSVEAATALGAAYLAGEGVLRDAKSALHWIRIAADAGDAKAQWNLGGMYISGAGGLPPDIKQAFAWCHLAADQNFAPAQATLGVLFERIGKFDQSVHYLRLAAQAGDPEAQYNLAMMFQTGKGVGRNAQEAFNYLVQAAEQGLARAQSRLALAYGAGDGVANDPIEAHKWLLAAHAANDELAGANLEFSRSQLSPAQIQEAMRRAQHRLK